MNPIFAYLTLCAFLGLPIFGLWRLWLYLKRVKDSEETEEQIDDFDVFAGAHEIVDVPPKVENKPPEQNEMRKTGKQKVTLPTQPKVKSLPPAQKKSLPLPAQKKSLPPSRKRSTN